MNIVVAMDSFKGSLSSLEAGSAVKAGIQKVLSNASISVRPLADGGEGTVEALVQGMKGSMHEVTVTGPLGTPVICSYGVLESSGTALIEISGVAGITLVSSEERNPMELTTYGVGEVIKDAIRKGCRRFIIGIGGSATNDGGIGMLQALGYHFLDAKGNQVPFGAEGLEKLVQIEDHDVIDQLKECKFHIACDVKNPLCGHNGCSVVYGPQKGASSQLIMEMDQWMRKYGILARNYYEKADMEYPGTGAAGGLGFAFLSFTNAVLESGIQIVLEETKLEDYVKKADIVITGEGSLDGQTAMGKAPIGVAALAKKYDKKVIAFAGCVADDAKVCNEQGIDAFFPIIRRISSLEEEMKPQNARKNIEDAVEQIFRLIHVIK